MIISTVLHLFNAKPATTTEQRSRASARVPFNNHQKVCSLYDYLLLKLAPLSQIMNLCINHSIL